MTFATPDQTVITASFPHQLKLTFSNIVSTLADWNFLSPEISNSYKIETFKCKTESNCFGIGNPVISIQMRTGKLHFLNNIIKIY